MKIPLADAPGGPEFIDRCADAVRDLSLFFVGEPEEKMLAVLEQTRRNLETKIAPILGAEVAAQIAEAFIAAVVGRRREIEAAACTMPRNP